MDIEFNKISFAYNKSEVLHKISGHFRTGGFYAVLGPNGCGKSTFLKCLNLIHKPQSGNVLINNKAISSYSKSDLAKEIGYVPQSTNSICSIDVYNIVMMGRKPYVGWLPGDNDKKIVIEIIKNLKLDDFIFRNMNELSGGEQQRVHMARALAQQPKVLLLDEPTSNLDLKYQIEVMEILKRISNNNITVIVAIHDVNLALRYASDFILMKNGDIIEQGDKEVINEDSLKKLYGTEISKISCDGKIFFMPE